MMDLKKNEHLVPEIVKNLVSRLNNKNTNTNEYNMAVSQLQAVRELITQEFIKKGIK